MKNKLFIYTGILSLLLFACLAINVLNGNAQNFNAVVYSRIELWITPALTDIMVVISNIAEWFIYLPIAVLFLIIPKSRMKIGLPVTISLVVSATLNELLKLMFAVERPDIHRLVSISGYGFPSGHAMNGTVFIGLCAYLFMRYSYKRPLKILVPSGCFVFMVLLGFSRIYLGVHTATDIMGGYLAGLLIVSATIYILQKRKECLIQNKALSVKESHL